MLLTRAIYRCKSLEVAKKSTFNIVLAHFSTKPVSELGTDSKKVKKPPIPKITLVSDGNVSIMSLEEAQKLSKRRDLKLVKVLDVDTKTQRPIYKMMTGTEFHSEDLKQRDTKKKERLESNTIKGEKVLIVGSNITEHDLNTSINKIIKWINKKYEVRLVINGDAANIEKSEKVFSYLESSIKDFGRILQKRQKGGDLKCQIMPPKKDIDKNNPVSMLPTKDNDKDNPGS